jgi:hypothetical protein
MPAETADAGLAFFWFMLSGVTGRLAQLGERRIHIAEVTGSRPVSPTTFFIESQI